MTVPETSGEVSMIDFPYREFCARSEIVKSCSELDWVLQEWGGALANVSDVTKYVLCPQVAFDAEKTSQCKLTVHAAGEGQSGETDVIVNIRDQNDNPPQFTRDQYAAHVAEDASVGSAVIGADGRTLVFEAVDADSGRNGRVTFEVVGCPAFSVDQAGRLITVQVGVTS